MAGLARRASRTALQERGRPVASPRGRPWSARARRVNKGSAMAIYMPDPKHDGPIPGEHDSSTLTHRQPGSIGGPPSGNKTPSPKPEDVMDAETIHDRER